MTTTQAPAARVSTDARAAVTKTKDNQTNIWWWVRTIGSALLLMAAVFVLAAVVVIPRVSGATAYTILTGSMEPKYPPGTLVVSKPVDVRSLRAGQVITFNRPDVPEIVTHRIDEIGYNAMGEMQIYTKGDNNNARDPWILHPDNVRGRLWYSVPFLGKVNNALTGKDKATLMKVGAGALILYALYAFGTSARDKRRKNADEPADEAAADQAEAQQPPAPAMAGPVVLAPEAPTLAHQQMHQRPAPQPWHAAAAAWPSVPRPAPQPVMPQQLHAGYRDPAYRGPMNPPAQQLPVQQHAPSRHAGPDAEITAPIPVVGHGYAPAGRAFPNQQGNHTR